MRVVNNIVTNAIEIYGQAAWDQINIRILDVGDFVQIEIEDNGKGISARMSCRTSLTGSTGRILREIPARAAAASDCPS